MAVNPSPSQLPEEIEVQQAVPVHPVATLQGPFEESMREAVDEPADSADMLDAAARRMKLLENDKYERMCAGRWKQKAGENTTRYGN